MGLDTRKFMWQYAFNSGWRFGCRIDLVRWGVEFPFGTLSEPISKCLMANLQNTYSSGHSRPSLTVDPEEFIKTATLRMWGPKSKQKYRVFELLGWKVIVSRSKFDDFHVWRPLSAPFHQIYFSRSEKTLKMLEFLIFFFELPGCVRKVPRQK